MNSIEINSINNKLTQFNYHIFPKNQQIKIMKSILHSYLYNSILHIDSFHNYID